MTLQDSSDLNPIQFPEAWSYFKVAEQPSPGAIPRNGISGFTRKTGWDKKKGKGTVGATLTLTDLPLAEGSITLQLWKTFHFDAWRDFRALLKYKPGRKPGSATAADAFAFYHPSLAGLDISNAVTEGISPAQNMGGGLYIVKIDLCEWRASTNQSIVATTAQSKVDAGPSPGKPPNPFADRQAQLARAMADAARTPVGF